MRILKRLVFVLFVVGMSGVADANACTCGPSPSPYQAYREATAVFTGKVVSSKDVPYDQTVLNPKYNVYDRHFRFVVEEVFKGPKIAEIDITVGRIDSTCYQGYTIGKSYLVYAYGNSERFNLSESYFGRATKKPEETLFSGACTRSNNLDSSRGDIYFIRSMLRGEPEPRVYGSVVRSDNVPNDPNSHRVTYLDGIKVIITSAHRTFETVTDQSGLYKFGSLPDGEYTVQPVLPSKYTPYFPVEEKFTLNAASRVYAGFSVGWNNMLSGRVLDSEGHGIRRAVVRLLSLNAGSEKMRPWYNNIADYLGPDSKYRIYGSTPGQYVVAIEVYAPFLSGSGSLRTYYPQTKDPKAAEPITIGETSQLELDLKLLPEQIAREVSGVMLWSNGQAVTTKADVFVEKLENSDDPNNIRYDLVTVGKDGRFTVQIFENAEYWIKGEVGTYGLKMDGVPTDLWERGVRDIIAKPIKVIVSKETPSLKLIVPLPERAPKTIAVGQNK